MKFPLRCTIYKPLPYSSPMLLNTWFVDFLFACVIFYPITRRQILDSSKLKEFADDNFKFDENGRKLSKQVENTGKRRNCSFRAISPFPTVFSKGLFPRGASKGVIVWKWVNSASHWRSLDSSVTPYYTIPTFDNP